MNLMPWEGFVIGGVFVLQFAFQIAAVVVGLVIWDRYLRRS